MHKHNCFVTLTYSDANLVSPKLIYADFQKFMKKLRKVQDAPIGVFVTGEYGDQTKRPHWHALLFNWAPRDGMHKYTNFRNDRVYESATLSKLWGLGIAEYGSVTFESAGYCARYAAKKLGHGKDGTHEFDPISKKSSKHAIGKAWLEKNWRDIFSYGSVVLPDGRTAGAVPRYYEKWLKENHPSEFLRYVTQVKTDKIEKASARAALELADWKSVNAARLDSGKLTLTLTETQTRRLITQKKFEQLQNHLKLK